MDANPAQQRKIEKLVERIQSLQPGLDRMSSAFRDQSFSGGSSDFNKWCEQDWCKNAFGNALVRLRQLIEQNFLFIETMGLLAVARYIFEVSVWLHLFRLDSRFGLVYYRELLETQLRYYRDTAAHLRREVDLLKSFERKEHQSANSVFKDVFSEGSLGGEISAMVKQAMDSVDAEASRRFSIYLDDAKTNGYGFQAYLVEKKAIPQIQQAIRQIEQEIAEFNRRVPQEIKNLAPGRWQWRQMADRAGLIGEYDYIYSYASKLLHATPASLTTDQKNLEVQEVYIFLRYIYAKLLEIMDVVQQQPECQARIIT